MANNNNSTNLNSFRVSLAGLALILGVATAGAAWQSGTDRQLAQVEKDVAALAEKLEPLDDIPYRVKKNEEASERLDGKIDNLSNAIIGQMDLMRRDVNRLTTTVEVLSSRVGMLTGDLEEPRQRRSRPSAAR